MINVLGLGRSVFISWHSDHSQGGRGGGEGGEGDGEKDRGVGEQGRETDPQLKPFIFIATRTDTVGQFGKEQVHFGGGKQLG